jgi:hypothetical protein
MAQEGKPIWIESTLTDEEYKLCAKKYPNMYTSGPVKPAMFTCEFRWRYRMGAGMSAEELKVYNKRISSLEEMLKKAKEEV